MSLQAGLSQSKQEKAELETRLHSLRAELVTAETQCHQLKREVGEVREFEQARARHQVCMYTVGAIDGVVRQNPFTKNLHAKMSLRDQYNWFECYLDTGMTCLSNI